MVARKRVGMKVSIRLDVLSVEDAQKAEAYLRSRDIATNGIHTSTEVEISQDQWKDLDEYQEDPNLPRFAYPQ